MAWREDAHITKLKVDQLTITGSRISGGITDCAIGLGNYSTPVALGEVSEHSVGLCASLSGYTDDASNFIPIHGKFTTTDDCAANAVAQAIYGRVDIKHDINGSYGVRGAITLAGAPAVHQAYALFGTLAMTACTISGTGGYLAALALEVSGTSDVTGDGKVCGMRLAWGQTNAMTVETVGSMIGVASGAKLDSGFRIDAPGTVTNAFHSYSNTGTTATALKVEGTHTQLLDLPDDEALAADAAANPLSSVQNVDSTGYIKVLIGSATRYIALYTATG